jgi:hypothetical protein
MTATAVHQHILQLDPYTPQDSAQQSRLTTCYAQAVRRSAEGALIAAAGDFDNLYVTVRYEI